MTEKPFIHPAALCETDEVGPGTRVWAFAHLLPGARVGADCNVCDHVFIEGGAVIGDRVTIKNNALIWVGVTIEDDVFIGPNVVFTNDLNPRAAVKKSPSELLSTSSSILSSPVFSSYSITSSEFRCDCPVRIFLLLGRSFRM